MLRLIQIKFHFVGLCEHCSSSFLSHSVAVFFVCFLLVTEAGSAENFSTEKSLLRFYDCTIGTIQDVTRQLKIANNLVIISNNCNNYEKSAPDKGLEPLTLRCPLIP